MCQRGNDTEPPCTDNYCRVIFLTATLASRRMTLKAYGSFKIANIQLARGQYHDRDGSRLTCQFAVSGPPTSSHTLVVKFADNYCLRPLSTVVNSTCLTHTTWRPANVRVYRLIANSHRPTRHNWTVELRHVGARRQTV